MNRKVMFSFLIVGSVMLGLCANVYADDTALSIDKISIGSRITAVDGDQGRYREDHYITDNYTGGIEELIMSGSIADTTLGIDMHALFDYDYGIKLELDSEDAYFVNIDTRQMRRYYDGSNEPWDPTLYSLGSKFADKEDGHIYIDRLDSTVEIGFLFDGLPNLTIGWERYERDGEETLLRGSQTAQAGQDSIRSIPAWRAVDGASDTISIKLDQQFAEKHNVALKQEYETYRDRQYIAFPRYASGALNQFRTFEDEPAFNEALTHASYNSFLNDKTYLTANYLYQNVKNTTRRTNRRANLTAQNSLDRFVDPEVNNRRDAHIVNIGLVLLDGLVKDLRVGVSGRFEKAITKTEGQGRRGSLPLRLSESQQDDAEYSQSLNFSYSGIKKTNLSFNVEAEQRRLNWNEKTDISDYELVSNFDLALPGNILVRETDVIHNDLIMTWQGSHRINNKNKVVAKYKKLNKKRKYEDIQDNSAGFYPGYLGSSEQDIDQILLRYDTSFLTNWTAGAEYVFEYNELGYAAQNGVNGQQLKRNRLSATATGLITDDFTLNVTGVGEKYDIETPGNGNGNATFAAGESAFDYVVELYLGAISGNYKFDDKTFSTLSYQHTEVTGTVRNSLDEVVLALNHTLDDNSSLETRLEWFNFNNKILGEEEGSSFDDYKGVAAQLIYNREF